MRTGRLLYHLARADFLERCRRYSFWVTVVCAILVAYAYLPPIEAKGVTFGLGGYRGIYNSAWVGSIIAVLCTTLLSLPGFYLVKNAIDRDQETGVGQILATTPLTKIGYLLGKLLSNWFFLAVMTGVITLAAVVMQVVRAESLRIQPWEFLAPYVFITLPMMALISATSLLFEAIPWLRKGFGNIAFFILYMAVLTASIMASETPERTYQAVYEPLGITPIVADMTRDVDQVYPDYDGGLEIGYSEAPDGVQTFEWDGVSWSARTVLQRCSWVGIAVGITLLAAPFFDRFDPARAGRRKRQAKGSEEENEELMEEVALPVVAPPPVSLPGVRQRRANGVSLFIRTLLGELRLLLKGIRWWWYAVALALALIAVFVREPEVRRIVYALAWAWPILIWSGLGCREARCQTGPIIFSAAFPLRRQLPATWLSGVLLALATGSGAAIGYLVDGQGPHFLALLAGAVFVPSLSLALGIWSGSSKLFEVVYVLLWYVGPLNGASALDFMGVSEGAVGGGMPFYVLAAAAVFLALAFVGRYRQMRQA